MLEILFDIIAGAAQVAVYEHDNMVIVHDGEPSRYLVNDHAAGIVMARYVQAGETVAVHRSFRLLVEPVDRVRIRSLVEAATTWVVQ